MLNATSLGFCEQIAGEAQMQDQFYSRLFFGSNTPTIVGCTASGRNVEFAHDVLARGLPKSARNSSFAASRRLRCLSESWEPARFM